MNGIAPDPAKYELYLYYYNHALDAVTQSLPVFRTLGACKWWGEYLSTNYRIFHDSVIVINQCREMIY